MKRRSLILSALALAAAASCTPMARETTPEYTTRVILIRHADRDNGAEQLNATGVARAAALPAALADVQIDDIYYKDLDRNRDTATPLAQARGLVPIAVPEGQDYARYLRIAAQGQTIVWIGNSDNIRPIWDEWGLTGSPPTAYGEIAIVRETSDGRFMVEEMRSY